MYSPPELDLAALVRHRVACGFDDPQALYESITDAYPDIDESIVDKLVDEMFAERDAAAASWPERTDCDRLDAAFLGLEDDERMIARHNFACCQTCGTYEIGDQIAKAREAKRPIDGYVFYHRQDTDSAVTSGVLHLRYGGTAGTPDAEIGARVVQMLRDLELEPRWNGDATKTIEVTLDWKRREPPIQPEPTRTAEQCVAWWCEALPLATRAAAATLVGREMPRALDALGLGEAALAWVRAVFDDGDRAVACARLAALRQSPELLLAAWKLAPWDRRGTFVQMLVAAGLDDPRVFAIARDKVDETRRDTYGGAAAAWFHVRRPSFEPAKERAIAEWRQRYHSSDDASLALAAALWRAGDETMREPVLEKLTMTFSGWARYAAIAAASTADDVLAVAAAPSAIGDADLAQRVCERLIELGGIAEARAFAKDRDESCEAYVAWITGDHERIAQIAARADEHVLQYQEGLITKENHRDVRIAIAAATNQRGLLADLAVQAFAEALADYREEALAHLAGDVRAVEESTDEKLETAIRSWSSDVPVRKRFAIRRDGRSILRAATSHARRKDMDRAEELLAIARAPFLDHEEEISELTRVGITDELVEACIAVGEVELVERMALETTLSARAVGVFVPALLDKEGAVHALPVLDAALARAETRRELLELLPAILAFASDDGVVRAAFIAADDALDALRFT